MKFFKESEFECPCCGKQKMGGTFLVQLDYARELAGVSFKVNSGWRCTAHNEEIGGSETSSHLKGVAADIAVTSSGSRHAILDALISAGFKRIGIAKSFIHVDSDNDKPGDVVWVYS